MELPDFSLAEAQRELPYTSLAEAQRELPYISLAEAQRRRARGEPEVISKLSASFLVFFPIKIRKGIVEASNKLITRNPPCLRASVRGRYSNSLCASARGYC